MIVATLRMLLILAALLVAPTLRAQDEAAMQTPISLSGISVSQTDQVKDGQPLDLENDLLIRLLYRVAKTSEKNFLEFSQYTRQLSISDVLADPREYRFWVFDLQGRVKGVEFHRIPAADSDLGLNGCYVVDMELPGGQAIKVVARDVPAAWLNHSKLDQPAEFHGFNFGTITTGNSTAAKQVTPQPLFLVNRIAWFPDVANEASEVGAAQVLLAAQGVDMGLLDQVKKQNTRPLNAADTACFFQMLNASRKITSQDLPPASADFAELMQNPTKHFADSVRVQGHVRRCIPVAIEDSDMAARLGFDQYYELDMLVPLGEQRVVVKNGPAQTLEYHHRFPVTVCVANLNSGMTIDNVRNQDLEVNGFFYRFWKYQSEFTDQDDGGGGQVSPLVIGVLPLVVAEAGPGIDRLLTYSVLALLVGGIILFWFMRPAGPSPSSITDRTFPERPDFSRLDGETD